MTYQSLPPLSFGCQQSGPTTTWLSALSARQRSTNSLNDEPSARIIFSPSLVGRLSPSPTNPSNHHAEIDADGQGHDPQDQNEKQSVGHGGVHPFPPAATRSNRGVTSIDGSLEIVGRVVG